MDWRQKMFQILADHPTEYISGGELAEQLEVSRTAIWKETNFLRKLGYTIESSTNRGYRMAHMTDDLMHYQIGYFCPDRKEMIIAVEETDSTNQDLQELALAGEPEGTVVIADSQRKGSGRLGRKFETPKGTDIYMSYLYRPRGTEEHFSLLTSLAGLAVSKALEEYGLTPSIKWPNDLIIQNRKVCGILTKLTTDAETATVTGAIIGIGINVLEELTDFPEELRDKAISVREAGVTVLRSELAAKVIRYLDEYLLKQSLMTGDATSLVRELESRSCTIGKRVSVISPTGSYEAEAIGLDEGGGLLVKTDDGTIKTISSGEVSVREILGYLPT